MKIHIRNIENSFNLLNFPQFPFFTSRVFRRDPKILKHTPYPLFNQKLNGSIRRLISTRQSLQFCICHDWQGGKLDWQTGHYRLIPHLCSLISRALDQSSRRHIEGARSEFFFVEKEATCCKRKMGMGGDGKRVEFETKGRYDRTMIAAWTCGNNVLQLVNTFQRRRVIDESCTRQAGIFDEWIGMEIT